MATRTSTRQGAYFLVTGVWPILHYRSFVAVTGEKTDAWLAKTTGGLIAAIGLALVQGGRGRGHEESLVTLGLGSALVLGIADVWYVARGRISAAYLVDALAEASFVCRWAKSALGGRRR
jgi:hypothetical protein